MNPIDTRATLGAAVHAGQQERLQASSSRDEKSLKKSSIEFEAMIVESMLKGMRSTVPESKLFPKSNAARIYEEMLDREVAGQIARKQSLGLAQQIYEQAQSKLIEETGKD